MGHFVSSPREREKSDRRDSRRDEREGQNESEETEEIKIFPTYPYLLQGYQALPNCKPISVGRPGDVRYTTPPLIQEGQLSVSGERMCTILVNCLEN